MKTDRMHKPNMVADVRDPKEFSLRLSSIERRIMLWLLIEPLITPAGHLWFKCDPEGARIYGAWRD